MGLSKSKNSKTKNGEKVSSDKSDSSGKDSSDKKQDEIDGREHIGNKSTKLIPYFFSFYVSFCLSCSVSTYI